MKTVLCLQNLDDCITEAAMSDQSDHQIWCCKERLAAAARHEAGTWEKCKMCVLHHGHSSDCAMHNDPAYPVDVCSCGKVEQVFAELRAATQRERGK
jgi:hypothetical protein